MPPAYYTFVHQVPTPAPGQRIAFQDGKGYYLADAAQPGFASRNAAAGFGGGPFGSAQVAKATPKLPSSSPQPKRSRFTCGPPLTNAQCEAQAKQHAQEQIDAQTAPINSQQASYDTTMQSRRQAYVDLSKLASQALGVIGPQIQAPATTPERDT